MNIWAIWYVGIHSAIFRTFRSLLYLCHILLAPWENMGENGIFRATAAGAAATPSYLLQHAKRKRYRNIVYLPFSLHSATQSRTTDSSLTYFCSMWRQQQRQQREDKRMKVSGMKLSVYCDCVVLSPKAATAYKKLWTYKRYKCFLCTFVLGYMCMAHVHGNKTTPSIHIVIINNVICLSRAVRKMRCTCDISVWTVRVVRVFVCILYCIQKQFVTVNRFSHFRNKYLSVYLELDQRSGNTATATKRMGFIRSFACVRK